MDPISLFMIAILGMLIYFMIRNSRKQRKTQEELQEKLKPGADVMTSFGLYAQLLELYDETMWRPSTWVMVSSSKFTVKLSLRLSKTSPAKWRLPPKKPLTSRPNFSLYRKFLLWHLNQPCLLRGGGSYGLASYSCC